MNQSNMEWIVNDKHLSARIVESQPLLDLKKWFFDKNSLCKVVLQACPKYFWWSDEQLLQYQNNIGVSGVSNIAVGVNCIGSVNYNTKPVLNTENVIINFQ